MLLGPVARALLTGVLVFVPVVARAQAPDVHVRSPPTAQGPVQSPTVLAAGAAAQPAAGSAQPAATQPAATQPAATQPAATQPAATQPAAARGAVVVAIDDGATQPARALARAIYRDTALRPILDETSARVLVGEAPAADAPASVKELAEARHSVSESSSEVIARRLLASIGAEAQAEVVVAVSMQGGRPVARVLRVATASYTSLELGATIRSTEPQGGAAPGSTEGGARTFEWPGATATLRAELSGASSQGQQGALRPVGQPVGPLAPHSAPATAAEHGDAQGSNEVWRSPWFWAAIGVVATAGITVFVLTKTSEGDSDTVHLAGRIAP